ncbi:MAG: MFS transporter [Gammaproteobacteria bacterium]|nr:MFS transporter [Gammaproteobacteria bacterium]MCW5583358.1 MFS transporter [Gammaproteobacteria bacterium]
MLNLNQDTLNDYSKKWLSFIGIALLSFGCYLDYTVVNVALPTIQQELQTSLTSLQWIMNIYFLALCVLATIMGRLGDLFGRRCCFYIGTGIFAIASIIAGCSPTIHWLILGRLLQGIGAAIVFPLGPSLLPESFPEKERARAIAWLGSMGGIALALGPVLGGIIVTYWGWRWIFFINAPIVLLGYLFCFKSIKESIMKQENVKLDWSGMLLLGVAMSGIVLGLIHGQMSGWNNILTLLYLVIGVIACVVLFKIESKHKNPLIDFDDFTNLLFYAGAILCFLAGVLSAVALFFDPLYLQIIRNQSPQLSGLILFVIPIAVFGVAFIVEWLISRLGIIHTILIGITLAVLSAILHAFFISVTPLWYVTMAFICLGSMWAMGNTVPIIAAQMAVDSHRLSVATGTMVTMFNIGGSIGLAVAVVVYQFVTSKSLKQISESVEMKVDGNQLACLEKLISNPARSLQVSMNTATHSLFNNVFIRGFSGVMWFLLILSVISFLSIFSWKVISRES